MIYFDHNATTPLVPSGLDRWVEVSRDFPGNPSSPHRMGSRASHIIEEARQSLADLLGGHPLDYIWTSSATECANMFFHHLSIDMKDRDGRVLVSAIEHPCVLEASLKFFPGRVDLIPVTPSGVVEADEVMERVKEGRCLALAIMAANNETGCLQPWKEIAELAEHQGLPVLIDAVQWIGKMPFYSPSSQRFVSGSAHKFGGPKGSAFLRVPRGRFHPMVVGGPQEEARRAGTENVAGIAAMTEALRCSLNRTPEEVEERIRWKTEFENELEGRMDARILGKESARLWNTTAAIMPDTGCPARWVVKLDKLGFAVSTGSACSSGKEKPSHVLTAMEISSEEASRVLRFSSGWNTTREEWRGLLEALLQVREALTAEASA